MPRIEKQNTVKNNQSVEKAFQIIEFMSLYKEPVKLQTLAQNLNYPSSTIIRFVRTLIKMGYIKQDQETLKYYLTLKICNIANNIRESNFLVMAARPYMKALSQICKESVCLAEEQDNKVVYIEVVDGPDHILKSLQRIGSVSPMHCTGVGKLLLLNKTQKELNRMIKKEGLKKFTRNTIDNKADLMAALNDVREQNYAFDNEECEIGVKCIAFPIKNYTNRIVAGISVTGTVFHLNDQFVSQYCSHIRSAANEISKILGYVPPE